MKGKVGEALAFGLPAAMTPVAAEGMYIDDGVHGFVADEPAALAERLVCLMRDDEVWLDLSCRGRLLVEERFSPRAVRPLLAGVLNGAPATEPVAGRTPRYG
jgi:glycosyltransferase involved in cell wall biosynthesis